MAQHIKDHTYNIDFKLSCITIQIEHTGIFEEDYIEQIKNLLSSNTTRYKRLIMDFNDREILEETDQSYILHYITDYTLLSGNTVSLSLYPDKLYFKIIVKSDSDDYKKYFDYVLDIIYSANPEFFFARKIFMSKYYYDAIDETDVPATLSFPNINPSLYPARLTNQHFSNNKYTDEFFWKETGFKTKLERDMTIVSDYTDNRHGETRLYLKLCNSMYKNLFNNQGKSADEIKDIFYRLEEAHHTLFLNQYK